MFIWAPITPHGIALSTANSPTPGRVELIRRNRSLNQISSSAVVVSGNDFFDSTIQGHHMSLPIANLSFIPCQGFCHPTLNELTKTAIDCDPMHQQVCEMMLFGYNYACWRDWECERRVEASVTDHDGTRKYVV